jgi:uncharacterized protein
MGGYTWRIEPHWVEFTSRTLNIPRLPAHWSGRRVVHISDTHVGLRVQDDFLIRTFQAIAGIQPELVVFTGDLVSHHAHILPQLKKVFSHFPIGRMGSVAILGNHDYGAAWSQPEVADAIEARVEELGITVLRNEVVNLAGLQICGLDDLWARRFDPARALSRVDPAEASLVLSHNPDTVDLPGWDQYEGWILSGHTHGGQCKPPFLPPPILPVRNRRYTSGVFELPGNRMLYINRGLGHLQQVRFNVRPEVTVFTLV